MALVLSGGVAGWLYHSIASRCHGIEPDFFRLFTTQFQQLLRNIKQFKSAYQNADGKAGEAGNSGSMLQAVF
ncbi:MAG TPA: hypothetical protein DHV59_08315 [Oxalobacteraceae bacterium]|nr:hypothetical protein [Oxalobacteraceae bacterium]